MPEFLGSDFQIAIPKRLHDAHSWIKDIPAFSNGGRVLNVLEPETVGWPRIQELANLDRCISFTAQPLTPALATLKAEFGADWDTPH